MDIMGIMLFVVIVIFPIITINKVHELTDRMKGLEDKIAQLEEQGGDK